ncbi:TetR/AcrR family transcriptional regulator [Streptomyces sp. NPDC050658]|uniref:TetR/AcrR family transcriptional regulator n=1 Tax=unclassified Streptomyces TaxID=2593676 RepID=UPI0034275633
MSVRTAGSAGSAASVGSAGSAAGSPGSLTERRKAETRLDIARTAAALFVENGLRATRAEDIARAAGVAPRTFYRYFATKEESVAPLFAAGAQQWAEAVREAPGPLPVSDALRHAAARALAAEDAAAVESLEWVRSLLRMAAESPALRAVWADACHASEQTLLAVLAERESRPSEGAPSLELRLAAALASSAVRVAVETWAAGDEAAGGASGPAALAERCIAALGEFRRP